jgi:hypothetical protein
MVYKTLAILLLFLLNIKILYCEIIYDKNDISITKIELREYQNIYMENYNSEISYNKALKEIVLMRKTIGFLLKNNPEFMNILDDSLESQIGVEFNRSNLNRDFLRFIKIRNEFISEYFQKDFEVSELKSIFKSYNEFKIPISKNDCLTIDKIEDLRDNSFFINNFYENLKKNSQTFEVKINNNIYDVCISNTLFKQIEETIIKYIELKTANTFNDFIYKKVN